MGTALNPAMLAAVQDLYRGEQTVLAAAQPVSAPDVVYGNDPRQRLDLYLPAKAVGAPILLWVHGGGFVRGEKASADHPFNAHAGRLAARNEMVGAVMNYRLAPAHGWPAGGEDVGSAIDWLIANAAAYGGDPRRIFAIGTSAGATHIATHLQLRGEAGLAGAILLSGLYGYTPLEDRDRLYYGDIALHQERSPREALIATALPLLLACSQYDPARFQAETLGLLNDRFQRHGALTRFFYGSGHNHFSLAYHLGSADSRLADEILAFIGDIA